MAYTALRSIRAFSRAANELSEELLETSSSSDHTVINMVNEPDFLIVTNIVKSQSIKELCEFGGVQMVALALKTDTENGIDESNQSIVQRRQNFGSNRIQKSPPKIFKIVLETIMDPLILVMFIRGLISLGFGVIKHARGLKGCSDGLSIILAVFIVIGVTSYCKLWPKIKIFKISNDSHEDFKVKVIRSGKETYISVFDVVVGDVICLGTGDQVPADGLYISGNSLNIIRESMGSTPRLKDF